jgi:hypothetical protein
MHADSSDETGRGPGALLEALLAEAMTAEATAAEVALREMKNRQGADWDSIPSDRLPHRTAMRGLTMAVPMSLAFWIAVGMLLWALMR